MVDPAVVAVVRRYLDVLRRDHALEVRQAVVFGSYTRAEADRWSDIDLVWWQRRASTVRSLARISASSGE